MRDAIGEFVYNNGSVISKPFRAVAIEPTAFVVELIRKVPIEKG